MTICQEVVYYSITCSSLAAADKEQVEDLTLLKDMPRALSQRNFEIVTKLFHAGFQSLDNLFDSREYDRRIHYAMANAIYGLRRRGFVEIKKNKNNQSIFHLTPKGRLNFLKHFHLEKLRSKKWDKHWRVIIFDIPENRKKMREYLRHRLKYLGFRLLQESVYITPYPVTGDLDRLLKARSLRRYFRYLTVTELDKEDDLKKEFGLK